VRVGPLRVSAFGLSAAVGRVGALWLSLRTAKVVGVEPAELWDAGLVGLTAGFGISRLLLVMRDWHAFVQYPMLVLALPSFTYLGMGLTAAVVGAYLWRRRLPVLRVMDAWAPCAAVLAVALELGHWMEGSDAGMPWRGGLVPVQAMGAVGAVALAVGLAWMLWRGYTPVRPKAEALGYQPHSRRDMRPDPQGSGYPEAEPGCRVGSRFVAGRVAGLGLILGGVMAFGLDMMSQPVVSGEAWLEPGQWVAVGTMVVGGMLLLRGESAPARAGSQMSS
jgi:phosphatidylglycerol:prolipoprotein diacylglycerol transferase